MSLLPRYEFSALLGAADVLLIPPIIIVNKDERKDYFDAFEAKQ